jgi:hypothetical protein
VKLGRELRWRFDDLNEDLAVASTGIPIGGIKLQEKS